MRTVHFKGGFRRSGRTSPQEWQKPNGDQTSEEGSSIHQKFSGRVPAGYLAAWESAMKAVHRSIVPHSAQKLA
jgi:hypothetical protein